MRKNGKLRGLKPLIGYRGYYHDGTRVYDRLGRIVPLEDGKAKILSEFKWVVVDLSKPKTKSKRVVSKVSEDKK